MIRIDVFVRAGVKNIVENFGWEFVFSDDFYF